MRFQQFLRTRKLFHHKTLDLRVDHLTSLWTDLAAVLHRSPQVLKLLTCIAHRTELIAHAEFRNHAAGQLSSPRNVVTGPGADRGELHDFCCASAQHDGEA